MSNRNLPTGIRDEFAEVAQVKEESLQTIYKYYRKRGFTKINTPALEFESVFKPLSADEYQPYQFLDEEGRTLVLRPDLTLPVARVMSSTNIKTPMKWYYAGDIFRIKRRMSGTYNETTQAGIEIIGYSSLKAEWECLTTALEIMQRLKISAIRLELGDARILPEILKLIDGDTATRQALEQALIHKNLTEYTRLLEKIGPTPIQEFLEKWPRLFGEADKVLPYLKGITEKAHSTTLTQVYREFSQTIAFLQNCFPDQIINLDITSRPTRNYYTGMTFRGFSVKSNTNLFSGGRYNDLLKSFGQTLQPAVGLAFNLDNLLKENPLQDGTVQSLIYFEPEQWQLAQKYLNDLPRSSLCLTDTVAEAQKIADDNNVKLIDLTQKGGSTL